MKLTITPTAMQAARTAQKSAGKQAKNLAIQLGWLLLIGLWAFGMIRFITFIPGPRPESVGLWFVFILAVNLFLGFYVTTFIHEVGHIVAGRLVDFRFIFVIVGPFKIIKGTKGLQFKYSGFKANRQFTGITYVVPQHDQNLHRRYLVLFAGGPVATITQIIFALMLRYFLSGFVVPYALEQALFVLAYIPLIIAPFMMAPVRIRGLYTDGARIRMFLQGQAQADYLVHLYTLVCASVMGTRPRDLDPEQVKNLVIYTNDDTELMTAYLLAYKQALDGGDLERAAIYLDKCLAQLQDAPLALPAAPILAEAAYCEALYNHNSDTARSWLDLAQEAHRNTRWFDAPYIFSRADAATLWAEENPEAAYQKAHEGLAQLEHTYDAGNAQAEKEWLESIVARVQSELDADGELPVVHSKHGISAEVWPVVRSVMGSFLLITLMMCIGSIVIIMATNKSLSYQMAGVFYSIIDNETKALAYFDRGLEAAEDDDDRARLYYFRGTVYFRQKQYEQALSNLNLAVQLDPTDTDYYRYRGFTYYRLDEYDQAVVDLTESMQLNPKADELVEALFFRAVAYEQLGKYELASADYEHVLRLPIDHEDRRDALSHLEKIHSRNEP